MAGDTGLERAVGELAGAESPSATGLARTAKLAMTSMKAAGAAAVVSGRWLADTAVAVAPHIPIRDLATLTAHHGGLEGAELAEALIRNAARVTAAIGAATGAMAAAEELSPPAWVAIPAELVVETLAIAAIEMKLIAELQEAYHQPVTGAPSVRGLELARAWADRRGVRPADLASSDRGLGDLLGRGTRNEVMRLVRRRMARRTARNLAALAPFLAGAVAGAEINRRSTRSLGGAVVRDLAAR
ncbi:MAG: hypothetical protein JWO37_118 [Acidimicrobiales bacterium]|nr:hypothetical protein [Acidimicrobiales bacterium]